MKMQMLSNIHAIILSLLIVFLLSWNKRSYYWDDREKGIKHSHDLSLKKLLFV